MTRPKPTTVMTACSAIPRASAAMLGGTATSLHTWKWGARKSRKATTKPSPAVQLARDIVHWAGACNGCDRCDMVVYASPSEIMLARALIRAERV